MNREASLTSGDRLSFIVCIVFASVMQKLRQLAGVTFLLKVTVTDSRETEDLKKSHPKVP